MHQRLRRAENAERIVRAQHEAMGHGQRAERNRPAHYRKEAETETAGAISSEMSSVLQSLEASLAGLRAIDSSSDADDHPCMA